jgi:osmoprotectant transport system ATP-binding protein
MPPDIHRVASTPAALEARGVSHTFGADARVLALDDVSVRVPAGGSVALVGESGSGKTTLLRCFNRMVEPLRGIVMIDDEDIRAQPPELLRRRIGYVQQDGGLLPHWTVQRNVELVPRLLGQRDTAASLASEALAIAGLPAQAFARRYPHELSGGQRQRAALARALAARPRAILLDEPFGALDAISRADLHEAFESARAATGVTTLLVTHDLAEAARLCAELVVMRRGRIEQQGTIHDLQMTPATPYVANLLDRALAGLDRLRGIRSEADA